MKPQLLLIPVLLSLLLIDTGYAQDTDLTEGYVVSLRSIYEGPDAESNTVGFLRPGEYVHLEHVHSLVYRVFRDRETTPAGYVVYPKLAENPPDDASTTTGVSRGDNSPLESTGSIRKTASDPVDNPGTVTEYSTAVRAASFGGIRWVHTTSNIRAGTGTDTDVIAQLPRGTAVKIGTTIGNWVHVYRADEELLDPDRALGFVYRSLLKKSPPPPVKRKVTSTEKSGAETPEPELAEMPILQALANPVEDNHEHILDGEFAEHTVYVTRTGTKYHLETCRHLRKSKLPMSLADAQEKRYEACKTCKPDKKLQAMRSQEN